MQEEKLKRKISRKLLLCKILIIFLASVLLIQGILYFGITVFTDKSEYRQGEAVEVTIENNSWHSIYVNEILGPYFYVEKFDKGKWIEVPSGRCIGWCAPSGPLMLLAGETKKDIWRKGTEGRYRIKIKASIFPQEYNVFMEFGKNIYSKEFTIR